MSPEESVFGIWVGGTDVPQRLGIKWFRQGMSDGNTISPDPQYGYVSQYNPGRPCTFANVPGEEPGHAIVRHDSSPRPALIAYANLVRQLQRAHYVGEVQGLKTTQRGFVFRKDDRKITVFWNFGPRLTITRIARIAPDARTEGIVGRPQRIRRNSSGAAILELNGDPLFLIEGR